MQKKIILIILALIVIGGVYYFWSNRYGGGPVNGQNYQTPYVPSPSPSPSTTPVPGTATVSIQNFAFSPATLTVAKGTTVTWTNMDSVPHQIKSATFNSSQLGQGQSFSFTFNTAGTFDYSCAIHPSMLGQIIVQ